MSEGIPYQTRLKIGQLAFVKFDQDDNNMRSEHRIRKGNVVDRIPSGHFVKIVGVPFYGKKYIWQEILYNGKQGWTAEGAKIVTEEGDELEPYLDPIEEIDYETTRLCKLERA